MSHTDDDDDDVRTSRLTALYYRDTISLKVLYP